MEDEDEYEGGQGHSQNQNGARETIYRVDERTRAIQNDLKQFRVDITAQMQTLTERIKDTETRANEKHTAIEKDLEENYTKKTEFHPIQKLVYGFVTLLTTTVIGTILATFGGFKH